MSSGLGFLKLEKNHFFQIIPYTVALKKDFCFCIFRDFMRVFVECMK